MLPREAGGSLWVSVRKEQAVLVVSVEDDGPGLDGGTLNAVRHGPAKLLRSAEGIVWFRRKPDDQAAELTARAARSLSDSRFG